VTESDLRAAITWSLRRSRRKAALIERKLRSEGLLRIGAWCHDASVAWAASTARLGWSDDRHAALSVRVRGANTSEEKFMWTMRQMWRDVQFEVAQHLAGGALHIKPH